MEISQSVCQNAYAKAYQVIRRSEPLTGSEWADKYFYLSSESSYISGRWQTLPYQIAILNSFGNDDIRMVDVQKSARVGYTKMLLSDMGYKAHHKKRKQALWQPTDKDADEFSKVEYQNMVRDVPVLQEIFPEWDTKSPKNLVNLKMIPGATTYIKGGRSGGNYRRITVDDAKIDELDAFVENVEGSIKKGGEGSPSKLAWKRTEGSAFRKRIRGSTPTNTGESQIEKSVASADVKFTRYVPCPNCGHEQVLEFGGKDTDRGMKWVGKDLSTVRYLCCDCEVLIENDELTYMDENGYWYDAENDIKTCDGLLFTDIKNKLVETPSHIAFLIWTIYSPFTTWRDIVKDWFDACHDPVELKTFINTTLGETYDAMDGESVNGNILLKRCEDYTIEDIPEGVVYITAGVDQQADRFEIQYLGFGVGYEVWVLGYKILYCDTSVQSSWDDVLDSELEREFTHPTGNILRVPFAGIDTGGHSTQKAYKYCKAAKYKGRLALKGIEIGRAHV